VKPESYNFEMMTAPARVGWIDASLPSIAVERLHEYIKTAGKKVDVAHLLAGNIAEQFDLNDEDNWFFNNYLNYMCRDYLEYFDHDCGTSHLNLDRTRASAEGVVFSFNPQEEERYPFKLDNFWVNYQKQGEFNPMHTHSGLFSFAIAIKIPTKWQDQHALPFSAKSSLPKTSDFAFQFLSPLGETIEHSIPMGPEREGKLLFFPAKMDHVVYPFYDCDETRITINGNITYNL